VQGRRINICRSERQSSAGVHVTRPERTWRVTAAAAHPRAPCSTGTMPSQQTPLSNDRLLLKNLETSQICRSDVYRAWVPFETRHTAESRG
jgi:hypothetical protein